MNIFKKAKDLIDKVVFQGSGGNSRGEVEYYTFDIPNAPLISLIKKPYTYFNVCSCQHCSIHGGIKPEVLCSYKIAIIGYLMGK